MKLNSNPIRGAAWVALLVGLVPAMSAQTQSQTANEVINDTSRAAEQASNKASNALRKHSANELTGMTVKNRNGDSLGKVKDFVIDSRSGQVVYTVIGSGGVLGIGETLHAVPVAALNYEGAGGDERLTLDIDSARWSQAPRFRKDRISSLQGDQEGRSTYEYYGQTWREPGQGITMQTPSQRQEGSAQQPAAGQSQFVVASDIIGKNIRSGSQDVGSIEDVLVQLQSRSAAVLLDPDDSFTGTDQKFIVPFNRLSLSGSDMLTTSLSREDFSSAQVAQSDSWAQQLQSAAGKLFIWPGAGSQRVAQDMNQQQSQQGQQTAQQQAQQGQPPVAQIREALQNDTSLAQQGGRNVQVLAQGDKVILLGTVQTEQAKEQIEDKAEKAAPGWSIDNQIRVATAEE